MATTKKTKKYVYQGDALKIYKEATKLMEMLNRLSTKAKKYEKLSSSASRMRADIHNTMFNANSAFKETCGVNLLLGTVYKD